MRERPAMSTISPADRARLAGGTVRDCGPRPCHIPATTRAHDPARGPHGPTGLSARRLSLPPTSIIAAATAAAATAAAAAATVPPPPLPYRCRAPMLRPVTACTSARV